MKGKHVKLPVSYFLENEELSQVLEQKKLKESLLPFLI